MAQVHTHIALVTVAGVVAAVGGMFLLLLVSLGDLSGRVTRLRELISPGATSVLLAFTLLGVLAASHSLQIPHA